MDRKATSATPALACVPMQPRRSLATALSVLALAVPLSACGFDYATERDYTPGAGTNNREGVVDILSAAVVSAEKGSGTVITTLVNGDDEARTLTAITGDDGVTADEFEPVEIPAAGLVNFAEPELEITLQGDFEAGEFVWLTFTFDDGESTKLSVPVVDNESSYWAGLDAS